VDFGGDGIEVIVADVDVELKLSWSSGGDV
jgi:hypothetical protein